MNEFKKDRFFQRKLANPSYLVALHEAAHALACLEEDVPFIAAHLRTNGRLILSTGHSGESNATGQVEIADEAAFVSPAKFVKVALAGPVVEQMATDKAWEEIVYGPGFTDYRSACQYADAHAESHNRSAIGWIVSTANFEDGWADYEEELSAQDHDFVESTRKQLYRWAYFAVAGEPAEIQFDGAGILADVDRGCLSGK